MTPYGGDKCRWGGLKLVTFDEKRAITRKRYKIDEYATDPSSARNALSYGVKNAKIGAVDPEILDQISPFFGHVITDVHK